MIKFTAWPSSFAAYYRQQGYWIDLPLTDILTRHQLSNHTALIDNKGSLTYQQLAQQSDQLAANLSKLGLHQGDTALVQLGNIREFYLVFFALLKLGVVAVNALASHQRHELLAYATQIAPRILIADREHPLFNHDQFLNQLYQVAPSIQISAWHNGVSSDLLLKELIKTPAIDFQATPTAADQVAFFQLSGGSTGTPKLIPRTHNDYYYSIRGSVEICQFTSQTRYLCALPIAHNFPMSSPGILGVLYAGGLSVLATDPSANVCFPLIETYQINVSALVPPAVSLWLQALQDWHNREQLSSLQLLQVGGARLSESLAARIPQQLNCQLQQVFGMAEGLVNYTRLDDPLEIILSSQGRPISVDDEVWVADSKGQRLAVGKTGRLMTRGPYTFRGYYQSPEYNAQCFDEQGFYCSGDLVSLDTKGNIRVQGREKDQINRGGEKIAVEEIENLLLRHPKIIHAALVAYEDELLGEKSCAVLVTTTEIKAVSIRRFLREQGIAEYKFPDRVLFRDHLPLTPVGKVDKRALRLLISPTLLAAKS